MVIVSLIILSISTYAWFLITNTPKVKNIALTADTLGDLKIADSITESGAEKAGTYGDELDLQGVNMNNLYLSPVTTKDGITFFKPIYTEGEVTSVEEVTDDTGLHKKYVYEKDFYLKAGEAGSTVTDTTAKNYDIYFVGYSTKENSGTYVADKDGATVTAANAIRISFTFSGGSLSTPVTVIYEPNCDVDNGGITESQAATKNSSSDASTTVVANMANFVMNSDDAAEYGTLGEKYGTDTAKTKGYSTIKQYKADHSFVPNSGIKTRSTSLVTIKEGEDIHVTMRIWLEGTDKDCMNTIAADQIVGQIQFISEENLDQFKEEETTTATESTSAAETTTTAGN
jgi:hypothetical protein